MRRALERETVTATSLDAALSRAESIAGRLPAAEPAVATAPAAEPRRWKVGDRARSRSGGWEGRIAALDRGGRRATLEAGGMRVTVEVDDLDPAVGSPSGSGSGS
jgi:dsDNA-specific endonuclease/ATPase MutS2